MTFAILSDSGTIPVDKDLFINIVTGSEISYLISLINVGVIPSCPELFFLLSESINLGTSYGSVGAQNMFC